MTVASVVPLLVAGMLITGCSNSLWSKWQDMQCVENCDDPNPANRKDFSQPVWQTLNMFIGETFCLIAVLLLTLPPFRRPASPPASPPLFKKPLPPISEQADSGVVLPIVPTLAHGEFIESETENTAIRANQHEGYGAIESSTVSLPKQEGLPLTPRLKVLFLFPALCDILGTTLMNVGLLFVPVSIYQMIRGGLVLFVGAFSVIFLKRRFSLEKWAALGVVVCGVGIVGWAGTRGEKGEGESQGARLKAMMMMTGEDDVEKALLGVFLILFAQIFTASQYVIEEKIMTRYAVPPLEAVGLEGIFGLLLTIIIMIVLHFTIGVTPQGKGGYFDVPTGWEQITTNATIWWSCVAIAISIAFFNFFGLAVTKNVSAAARSTIDSCRTLGIWVVSLGLGWERFRWMQVLGFAVLVYGTFVFNEVAKFPFTSGLEKGTREEVQVLIDDRGSSDEEQIEDYSDRH